MGIAHTDRLLRCSCTPGHADMSMERFGMIEWGMPDAAATVKPDVMAIGLPSAVVGREAPPGLAAVPGAHQIDAPR